MSRSRIRGSALLLAAFQLGVTATVPVADAMLDFANAAVPIHVESARDVSCGDGHDHQFCQLCRTLVLGSTPEHTGRTCHADLAPTFFAATADDFASHATVHVAGPLGSRAPPLA